MRWQLLVAGLLCAPEGCSTPRRQSPRDQAERPALTDREARSIAERSGREEGYDLTVFRIVSVERVDEGTFRGSWRVSFEHRPPTPPGGHFTVYVHEIDGSHSDLIEQCWDEPLGSSTDATLVTAVPAPRADGDSPASVAD